MYAHVHTCTCEYLLNGLYTTCIRLFLGFHLVDVTTADEEIQYSAKIINPENKEGYIIEEWRDVKFTSVEDMRDTAFDKFEKLLINHDFLLGYLSPGRAWSQRQAISFDK